MAHPHRKRRIKLVRPGLQLRLVLTLVGVSALAMLMQTVLLGWQLTSLANELPAAGGELAERLPTLLVRVFVLSSVLFLPLLYWVGVQKTFRVAGPVSKLEAHLAAVRDGAVTEPCRIRRTDELQELCVLVNEALAAVAARAGSADSPGPGAPSGFRQAVPSLPSRSPLARRPVP